MTTTTSKGIWIVTEAIEEVAEGKGGFDIGAEYGVPTGDDRPTRQQSYIGAEELQQNLGEFIEVVEISFDQSDS